MHKVVIDCSQTGQPPADLADRLRDSALRLLEQGEPEAARNVLAQATAAQAGAEQAVVRVEPLTEAEVAQLEEHRAAARELAWRDLRAERDRRLAASDWTQLPDAAALLDPNVAADWARYRQELRDVPDTVADPFEVEWPTPPGGTA